jgi:hypothetical protein
MLLRIEGDCGSFSYCVSGDVIYKKFCREVAVLFWKTGETENVDRINAMSMLLADISEKETTESLLTTGGADR